MSGRRVVLDTNVVVSGFLNSFGAPGSRAAQGKKGTLAGARAAGESVVDASEEKKARAKYMRSKIDASRIPHALIRNEWYSWLSVEAPGRGVGVADLQAEGGSRFRTGPSGKAIEPDGRVVLAAGTRQRTLLIESDTGSQRRQAIVGKVTSYGDHLVSVSDYGRDPTFGGAGVPLIVFISRNETRSKLLRRYVLDGLARPSTRRRGRR